MAEPGTRLRVAVPDLISPSYFPMIAAARLGLAQPEGFELDLSLLFPVTDAAHALARGDIDVLAGAAHAALDAFPGWRGVRLLAALSQHTYWFLVVRADLGVPRGGLGQLADLRIAAAPGPDVALRVMLEEAGVAWGDEPGAVRIVPVGSGGETVSFGVAAAEALAAGRVDGFWANGMGAEVAVRRGVGTVVVDARRGDGPAGLSGYTFPAAMATDRTVEERPDAAVAVARSVRRAHDRLRNDPELANVVVGGLFPAMEAGLIAELISRDLPYYHTAITGEVIARLDAFATRAGLRQSRDDGSGLTPWEET